MILGTGDGTGRVRALADELGVGDSIIMPGVRVDVARFYSLFDAFFMPSLYEGFLSLLLRRRLQGFGAYFRLAFLRKAILRAVAGSLDLIGLLLNGYPLLSTLLPGRDDRAANKLALAGYSAETNAENLMEFYEGFCADYDLAYQIFF